MGKRVEGRTKRKSRKAKQSSVFSSKRKLSRFGKNLKTGQTGPSNEYMGRTRALKKLNITLKDFRRICIIKGIYPRVPPRRLIKERGDQVYYLASEIRGLTNDPVMMQFMTFKSAMNKVRNAANRREHNEARRKHSEISDETIPMTEVIKRRYPRFIDAVRELPDCLSLICLFASLPSKGRITSDVVKKCKTLKAELFYWIAKAQVLDFVFVSIKGIYYQISVRGERVVFLVPHPFNHDVPVDVDLKVFATYLSFNTQFLEFVLFKLYAELDLTFPPAEERVSIFNPSIPTTASSISLHSEEEENKEEQEKINSILAKHNQNHASNDDDDEDEDEVKDEEDEEEEEEEEDMNASRNLFKGLVFYVSREVQWEASILCILSYGGRIERFDESNPLITHMVIDRPSYPKKNRLPDREYIQPQWLFDSINKKQVEPCHLYEMGTELPFHYSPFDADTEAAIQENEQLEDLEKEEHALKNQTEEEQLLELALNVKDKRIVESAKRKKTKILGKKIKKKRRRQEFENSKN